jgi:hypothetical protein
MPIQNVQRGANLAGDSVTTGSVTVTANAVANTKGAWQQVFASTVTDSGWLVVQPDDVFVSATNTGTLLDVGVGAAGVEQVIVPNIVMGAWQHGSMFMCPMFIPAGSRVSIRIQSAVASKAFPVKVNLLPCAVQADACQWCEALGVSAGTSGGTTLPTPSVAGTKTAWVQLSAGLTRDTSVICWSMGTLGTNIAAAKGGIDIGYGPSGQEQPLVANARWEQLGTENINPCMFPVPCNLPAGTRIAARFDSTSTAAASVPQVAAYAFA